MVSGTILGAVAPVFVFLFLGVLFRYIKLIKKEADASLMNLVINVFLPALIFTHIVGNPNARDFTNLVVGPFFGFTMTCLGFAIAFLTGKLLFSKAPHSVPSFAFITALQNSSFVPLMLAPALFPDHQEVTGLIFVHNLGIDLAIWSVGIIVLSGQFSLQSLRKVVNVPLLVVVFSLVFNQFEQDIPGPVEGVLKTLGSLSIPLGLILAGASLSDSLKGVQWQHSGKVLLGAPLLRLALLPLLMLGLALILPLGADMKRVIMIQAAMPTGVFSIVIARHYKGDVQTAMLVILFTNLLALFTLPFWLEFGKEVLF